MNAKILDALKRLVGEDNAEALAGQSDDINERVADEDLIARSTEEETTEPEAGDPDPEPAPDLSETPPDVVVIREMRTKQTEILSVLETLTLTMDRFVGEANDRLAALEVSEQERRDAWVSDLPVVGQRTVVRPRVLRQDPNESTDETVDTSARVAALLAEKGLAPG